MNEFRGGPSRFITSGVTTTSWLFAGLIPGIFLLRFLILTFYAVPEHDDFCFSYMNLQHGFAETIAIFYKTISGRILPLFLMQVPAGMSDASGIDFFMCYVATLVALEAAFVACFLFLAYRLWPRASMPQLICFGAAFAATLVGTAPIVREMLYWLPGVACYMVPGTVFLLIFAELVRSVEETDNITRLATTMLAVGCLIASLSNEFTAIWLIGLISGSLAVRRILGVSVQVREHAIMAGVTLVGAILVWLAPGNSARMGQLPGAGNIGHSITDGLVYSLSNLARFVGDPAILAWLLFVVIFTAAQPAPTNVSRRTRTLLAMLVTAFSLACGYLTYVAHEYATGLRLVPRAQNETAVLLLFGLTMTAVLLTRAHYDLLRRLVPRGQHSFGTSSVPLLLAAILVLPIYNSKTWKMVQSEQKYLHTFWLESMQRHIYLTLLDQENVAIPKHSVAPTIIMGGDITDDPTRLPNDCLARFYGKRTLIAAPGAAAK